MKNFRLFFICACISFPPWGFLLKPLGVTIQLAGLGLQLVGFLILLIWRKKIF